MKNNFQAFLKVAMSNVVVMALGIVSTLIIPIVLGPAEFGLWQLYLLYSSYVGLMIFGYNDGIYLVHGGKDYKKLNYNKFSAYFYILAIYLTILTVIGIIIVLTTFQGERQFILLAVCITLMLQCLNSYFVLINQATSRFNIYSIANIAEKLIFVVVVILSMIVFNINFKYVIIISLISKLIVLLINIIADYKLVFTAPTFNLGIYKDIRENIAAGIFLTVSGVFSMLITGVGRFLVENQLGIEQFGYYSFSFSVLTIVTQVIVAASVVLFPMLRNTPKEELFEISSLFDTILEYCGVIINLLYYPIYLIVIILLPKYTPSLTSILFIFPILTFQSRISIVYNTAFKVLRMERRILYNGLITLIFGTIITFSMFYVKPSIVTVSLATLITYGFWYYVSYYYLNKQHNKKMRLNVIDFLSTVVFILLNLYFPLPISFLSYFVFIVFMFIFKNKQIKVMLNIIKNKI